MHAHLPFETFLIATEPVWVWNADTKTIVWANASARALWGETDLVKLQKRRFAARAPGFAMLSKIALKLNGGGEWSGPLTLAVAGGKRKVHCQVQRLELAGGAHGVIVKSSPEPQSPSASPLPALRAKLAGKSPAMQQVHTKKPQAQDRKEGKQSPAKLTGDGSLALQERKPKVPDQKEGKPQRKSFRPKAADLAYLAGLSHDLRNPLTAIIGFADLMKSAGGRLSPELIADYADAISKSATFALDLASEVMDYAKSGQAKPQAPAEPVSVADIAAECMRLTAPLADRAGLPTSFAVATGLPALRISARNLKQILLNLLLNSVKFSAPGGEIKLKAALNKSGALVISIDDRGQETTGPAMLQAGHATAIPGAGLGLAMVKRLIKEAQAKMQRRKRPGGGTSTKLIFPENCLA